MSATIPTRKYSRSQPSKQLVTFGNGWGLTRVQLILAGAVLYLAIVGLALL